MFVKGKESEAKKFFDYKAVEAKHDIDFLEAIGTTIDQQLMTTIDEEYDKVKRQFLDTSSRTRKKAWADLIEFLKSQELFAENWDALYPSKSRVLASTLGSRDPAPFLPRGHP